MMVSSLPSCKATLRLEWYRREEMEMEEDLDAAYQGYLQRQGVRAEAARQKRQRLGMEGELGSDEEEGADPNKPEYEPGSDVEEVDEVGVLQRDSQLAL